MRQSRLNSSGGGLLHAFHGGDPGLRASLRRVWEEGDPEELTRGVDRDLAEYMGRVDAA